MNGVFISMQIPHQVRKRKEEREKSKRRRLLSGGGPHSASLVNKELEEKLQQRETEKNTVEKPQRPEGRMERGGEIETGLQLFKE